MLNSFEHTAFRFEVRDRYDEPDEAESFTKHLAGEPVDLAWMQELFDLVRGATATGRRFARVRVVTLPLTDYSRFGVWCALVTNDAGATGFTDPAVIGSSTNCVVAREASG